MQMKFPEIMLCKLDTHHELMEIYLVHLVILVDRKDIDQSLGAARAILRVDHNQP
jgi:hypothetical protein